MRTNKELLTLFLNNKSLFSDSLCQWIIRAYNRNIISRAELHYLLTIVEDNKPLYSKIFRPLSVYYWKPFEINPRIKFLKKHLK